MQLLSIHYEAGDPDELYIKVRPGSWTEKFLNAKDLNGGKEALCQYGYLAKSTLQINPYRQRLASKLAIFLTIMSRIRRDGRYEVGTLLERLEPKELMETVQNSKQRRNTLITQWDNALLTLHELGWQIEFDAATYPECIKPEWSLTDEPEQLRTRPRNWLSTWLKAIVTIKPTVLIQEKLGAVRAFSRQKSEPLALSDDSLERLKVLSGAELLVALDTKGWSKAHLAASGRGIEADLLPNPRFGLQALELRRRAAGNMSPTRFKHFWKFSYNTVAPTRNLLQKLPYISIEESNKAILLLVSHLPAVRTGHKRTF